MSYAQFYTCESVSDHLVSFMHSRSPANILDIGCGESNLLLAAGRRWKDANLIGFDIDPKHAETSNQQLHLNIGDGLDPDLSKKIIDSFGLIDIAVSNPPYLTVDFDKRVKGILANSGLDEVVSKNIKKIPSELVFLAQNLLVMQDGGEIGIILPAGLVCGERWSPFREYITSEYSVKSCMQLPNDAFKKAEVTTFILYLKKEKSNKRVIKLDQIGINKTLSINKNSAVDRMDYAFYSYKNKSSNQEALGKFKVDELFRGNMTDLYLSNTVSKFLHTSDLDENYKVISTRYNKIEDGVKYAQKGDIIIARVGSRCVGKMAYMKYGRIPITDCLFVLRSKHSYDIWNLVKSKDIGNMLKIISLGVGAKYITKKMLKEIFYA